MYRGKEAVRRIKQQQSRPPIHPGEPPPSSTWNADPAAVEAIEAEMERRLKSLESDAQPAVVNQTAEAEFSLSELAENELLAILHELSYSSPEARELLRDIMNRVEEHFFFDNFRRIE